MSRVNVVDNGLEIDGSKSAGRALPTAFSFKKAHKMQHRVDHAGLIVDHDDPGRT
jgi:hypothetical protein